MGTTVWHTPPASGYNSTVIFDHSRSSPRVDRNLWVVVSIRQDVLLEPSSCALMRGRISSNTSVEECRLSGLPTFSASFSALIARRRGSSCSSSSSAVHHPFALRYRPKRTIGAPAPSTRARSRNPPPGSATTQRGLVGQLGAGVRVRSLRVGPMPGPRGFDEAATPRPRGTSSRHRKWSGR